MTLPDKSPAGAAPRLLVLNGDADTVALLEEWLAAEGCRVVTGIAPGDGGADSFALAIVDIPFPRQGGLDLLRRVAREHPRTPLLALSSNFFASVERAGPLARALGVNAVLAKPVARETLVATVRDLLREGG